jgi:Protein of unknown function (DUF3141)
VLARILPPDDAAIDLQKPPIVVVDPRAGHGPGIGGMKPESEIWRRRVTGGTIYVDGDANLIA